MNNDEYISKLESKWIFSYLYYLIILNCKNYNRNENFDFIEMNVNDFVKDKVEFPVYFWLQKKQIRKSIREISKITLHLISGASQRNDFISARKYLKDGYYSIIKLLYGNQILSLLETKIQIIIISMGDNNYQDFFSLPDNVQLSIQVREITIIEATKLNLLKY